MTEKDGLDLLGLGKVIKAIPDKVYTQSTKTILKTFSELISPITESTSGLGRYIKQKFDNRVEIEKALLTYTLEKAVKKAELKANEQNTSINPPVHFKSFVNSLEESSQETDPVLHEMWVNLIASQLVEPDTHPHFVKILPHFSPVEAQILSLLLPKDSVGENSGEFLFHTHDSFKYWVKKSADKSLNDWNLSCVLLCEFGFAGVLSPHRDDYSPKDQTTILYKTKSGSDFLKAVS